MPRPPKRRAKQDVGTYTNQVKQKTTKQTPFKESHQVTSWFVSRTGELRHRSTDDVLNIEFLAHPCEGRKPPTPPIQ